MKKSLVVLGIILLSMSGCTQEKSSSITPKVADEKEAEVIIAPIDKKKALVITKVKPEIDVVDKIKKPKDAIPVVIVDPVKEGTPIKAVEILPADENSVPIIDKIEPTIEVVDVVPLEDDNSN